MDDINLKLVEEGEIILRLNDSDSNIDLTLSEEQNLNFKLEFGTDVTFVNLFLGLADTFKTYDRNGGKILRVNAAESEIEVTDSPTLDVLTVNQVLVQDYLNLDVDYVSSGIEPTGSFYWDDANKTISVVLENEVIGQMFEEAFISAQNDTGSTLENGTVATYAGSIGNSGNIRIEHTVASSGEEPKLTIGIVTQNILNGNQGKVTTRGKVRGIQTNGANYGETWSDGDILYKSSTIAGGLTNIPPEAPIPAIPLAVVISAHSSNGTILVRPTFPMSVTMLTDVNGTPIDTTGQIMVWDNDRAVFDFTENIHDYVLKEGIYAAICAHDNTTAQSIPTGNDYVKFMYFIVDNKSNNMTVDIDNSRIIVHSPGRYLVNSAISFRSGTANINVLGSVFLNGVEQDCLHFRRKISTANDEGAASITGIIDVTEANSEVDLRFRHDAGGSVNLTVTYSNLNVSFLGSN